MYAVKIDLTIALKDCPDSGLPAIDWRRENNLPPEPTKYVTLKYSGECEPLCRRYPALVNDSADMSATTCRSSYSHNEMGEWRSKEVLAHDGKSLYRSTISADLARPFLGESAPTPNDVAAVLDSLIAQATACKAAAEVARQQREAEDAERKAASAAAYAEQERIKAAAKAAELAERNAWIDAHGSTRLKRSVAEGIECGAAYRDERLAVERPGWLWSADTLDDYDDPRNVQEEAFALLDEARKSDPKAELKRGNIKRDEDDYGDEDSKFRWIGYVAIGEFLGRGIVYGIPESVLS